MVSNRVTRLCNLNIWYSQMISFVAFSNTVRLTKNLYAFWRSFKGCRKLFLGLLFFDRFWNMVNIFILFLHRIFWSRVPNGSTRRYNIKVSFLLPVAKCCVARARAHEERCTSFTTIIQAPSRNRKILLLPWLNTTTPALLGLGFFFKRVITQKCTNRIELRQPHWCLKQMLLTTFCIHFRKKKKQRKELWNWAEILNNVCCSGNTFCP